MAVGGVENRPARIYDKLELWKGAELALWNLTCDAVELVQNTRVCRQANVKNHPLFVDELSGYISINCLPRYSRLFSPKVGTHSAKRACQRWVEQQRSFAYATMLYPSPNGAVGKGGGVDYFEIQGTSFSSEIPVSHSGLISARPRSFCAHRASANAPLGGLSMRLVFADSAVSVCPRPMLALG